LDWRTVYLIEYIGPLAMHIAFVAARPYIYKNGSADMSSSQWLAFYMTMAHYLKREVECIFVHKFSANTMPASNIFKNCGHYWVLSGLLCGYFIYHPASLSATSNPASIDLIGLAIFLFGEIGNAMIHLYFASLRTSGGTERQVPMGSSFDLVTCPNYMYEIIAWTGVLVVTRSWAVAVFMAAGTWQMWIWGKGKERAYRTEFGDRYKKKRYMVLPGLL
jgi:very-long-chain enoyl-CoA reductase